MEDTAQLHHAFYRFVDVPDPVAAVQALHPAARSLLGSIVVAPDGINAVVCGGDAAMQRLRQALDHDPVLAPSFRGMTMLRTRCRTPPFQRLRIHRRAELLRLGRGVPGAVTRSSQQVSPQQWAALLDSDDVVVIDNRNSFEYRLGRFRGAVDPGLGHFRELPGYVEQQAPRWRAQGKRIAMYCTGGIRCERAAAWIADQGLQVLQLSGGILNYLAQGAPRGAWEGHCYVFDNRVALDADLQECGVTAHDVFAALPGEQWRLQRAQRLSARDDA